MKKTHKKKGIEDELHDVLEIVSTIAERMATQNDIERLDVKIDGVEQRLIQRIDGLSNRLDRQIDKHQMVDVRVGKLEKRVFAK